MYKDNNLYDIYQTIIDFGNYIRLQYLSEQINLEIDFGQCYDVDFDSLASHDELIIYSTENSTAIVISEYNKIKIIKSTDTYISFKIELKNNAYINLTIEK